MSIFEKLFIRDYKNTADPTVRSRYGMAAGGFGIVSNTLLCAIKIAVGVIGHSVSIIADGLNNLSDAGSSVATIVGFKLTSRPPDKEHPFGHARYEYLTALFVAMLVLSIGVILGKTSIEKIISPEALSVSTWTYVVLSVSILGKLIQMLLYRKLGNAIDSGALRASAMDARNDMLATLAALISAIVFHTAKVNIDGYAGLFVSLFIVVSALKLIKETLHPLLGAAPDKSVTDKIRKKILAYPQVLGIHDLILHSYGANRFYAVVHLELASDTDFAEAHALADRIEKDFPLSEGITLSIHLDPVDVGNEESDAVKARVTKILSLLDSRITIHDFRLTRTDSAVEVSFDAVVPYDKNITEEELQTILKERFHSGDVRYDFHVTLDKA